MRNSEQGDPLLVKVVFFCIAVLGLALVMASFLVPEAGSWHNFLRELLKELGIVLLAVFGVSLVYELILAKRYSQSFLRDLQSLIAKGESNSAVCERLGIERIYASRDLFERDYPLSSLQPSFQSGSSLTIVARSLFLVMGKPSVIRDAIMKGVRVELCLLSPLVDSVRASRLFNLETLEIQAALSVFRREIVEWLENSVEKPPGSIELRFHQVDLFDSWSLFVSTSRSMGTWDLSFGRDLTTKRIFVVDPRGLIGKDLAERYRSVYDSSDVGFQYRGNSVLINKIACYLPEVSRASAPE